MVVAQHKRVFVVVRFAPYYFISYPYLADQHNFVEQKQHYIAIPLLSCLLHPQFSILSQPAIVFQVGAVGHV